MNLTEAECERLAEEVFDTVVEPSLPMEWHQWAMQRRMENFDRIGVFSPPPILIINDEPVYPIGELVDHKHRAIDREYAESMRKLERKELVPLLKAFFIREGYTLEHKEELLSGYASHYWWQIMEEIEKYVFSTRKGRKPKALLADYGKIATLAEELVPVCEELLRRLEAETKHTIKEILEFLKTDYPRPSIFLLSQLPQLESALTNKKFLERRKTLRGRARLLANGLAGAGFGLKLSSSAAIAAQGKRHPT